MNDNPESLKQIGEEAWNYLFNERLYQAADWQIQEPLDSVKSTQKVLIVLSREEAEPSSESGQMLDKMLAAIDLDRSGCRLIDAATSMSYRQLAAESDFELLLVFGFTPADFQLHVLYKPCQQLLFQGHSLIFCPPLSHMLKDSASKRVLWDALRAVLPPL